MLLVPTMALAQQAAMKVGIVDMQRAASENNEGIAAAQALQASSDQHNANLAAIEQQLTDAQTRYETQQRALNATALAQLEAEITRLQLQLQRGAEDAELDMQIKQIELVNPIYDRVQQTVLAYAEEQRFTLILDAATAGVMYASTAADVTSEIVRRMNDTSSAPAPETPVDEPAILPPPEDPQ
jgi:outer membrane protein